jgi:hypothetical protein
MSDTESKPGRGGKRPGAGRPPGSTKKSSTVDDLGMPMLDLLRLIALGHIDASPNQLKAAIAAAGYENAKPGEIGKKEQQQAAAEEIAHAFPTTPAPMRVVK